jgi:hypothetical protein
MVPAQAVLDRRLPDELVDMLLGQDDLDDIRREFVRDLLLDALPSSPPPPGTGLESRPPSTPVPTTVEPAGEKGGILDNNPSRDGRSADAANGSQAVEPSAIESDGSAMSARLRIARPSGPLLAATLGTTLPRLMTEFARRRRRRDGARVAAG